MTDVPPELTALKTDCVESTGASNVNSEALVPLTAPTVIATFKLVPPPPPRTLPLPASYKLPRKHATEVDDDHAAVRHANGFSAQGHDVLTEAVSSEAPKLSPETVTDATEVPGLFSAARLEVAAASNENVLMRVPTTAETVTTALSVDAAPVAGLHLTDDVDVQLLVVHAVLPRIAEDV